MDSASTNVRVLWILLLHFVMTFYVTGQMADKRCETVAQNFLTACDTVLYDIDSAVVVQSNSEIDCVNEGHCWHSDTCYRKPAKCYIDFRYEQCPLREAWSLSRIYIGYSVNGSNCYVDVIRGYIFHPNTLWGATSKHGVRILGPGEQDKACVTYMKSVATRMEAAPDNCNLKIEYDDKKYETNGTVRAKKCVVKQNGHFVPYEMGAHNTCRCRVDCWKESVQEQSIQSYAIQEYVEKEESKSPCAGILGKLVRESWRSRVEIVNSAEVEVVVDALLNTTGKATFIDVEDAKVLLDTSKQLSKYKFYEGLENDSANHLIQSTTKFVNNIMTKVKIKRTPRTAAIISKRSAEKLDSSSTDLHESEENRLQWQIMENLEGIAENIASLIDISGDRKKYVVEAKEEAVSLQIAIAKHQDLDSLMITDQPEGSSSYETGQRAGVTNFSSYSGDHNVAVITAFYDVAEEKVNSTQNRVTGIIAISPKTIKDDMINESLSLPVIFTLSHSNTSCNGSCERLCSFARASADTDRSWKQTGCRVINYNDNETTCECNHTTHFAVLMMPTTSTISKTDTLALEYLSIILGSISVAALAATVIVFIIYRRILLKDRMLIHFHMIIALMGGYISFLCGSVFSSGHLNIPDACFAFAIGSHFFLLATFFWFLMEAVYLFYKVVLVFSNSWAEWGTKFAPALGWGVPSVTVAVAVGISRALDEVEGADPYYDPKTCFLQIKNGMIWSFLAPVYLIIVINILVLVKVVIVIFKSSLSSAKKVKSSELERISKSVRNSAKGILILMPILGIPWIANVFVIVGGNTGTIIAYIHVILMGLQGVSIFMFYCVFNTEVRMAYKLSAERRRSMATLETTSKMRKRSNAPLIMVSKENSPEASRYKNSLTVASTGRTFTGTSHLSASPPSSPNGSINPLPTVQEEQC